MTKKKQKGLMASFILVSLLKVNGQIKISSRQSESIPEASGDSWSTYVKGFIQADAMFDFQEMAFKDGFSAPSIQIPQNSSASSNFSIKQSQIGLGIKKTDSEGNSGLSAYVEIDFLGPNGTTAPRFRHGYIQWKNVLIGQTWSNFSDFDIFPNIFDFVGPNGVMFARTIQVRYSTPLSQKEKLSISLEDPNGISIFLPNHAPNWKKKSLLPVFTAVYRYGNERDYYKLGAIVSPISYEIKDDSENSENNMTMGFGGMVSGKIYSGKLNNFRFQSSYGKGYSNYNAVLNGEKYDAVPDMANNRLVTLSLFNIVGIYEHWWSPKWSSVVYYSYSQLGREEFVPDTMTHTFQNLGINLAYQPFKKLRLGIEGTHGRVKNFGRQKANATRIQLSTSLSF
ncbi:DcaP family trimeric outer membrane transporter [Chryseobacterium pennipullorum]|uniref:Porin n=1 Tax=Chryseobacterium pennipullorum TaxID=2258963 RepID=A0A3D9B978_9FLAO|nr:DcaP family trimeric outer membrane transporter [Chryseobacterium pennipullorum]REC50250.1 hypothetical protein DRF67_01605 [Chryseobacterium pennipullorum]